MSDLAVEVFREDADNLTRALLSIVRQQVGSLPNVDRAVIVAAALANVACYVDAVETGNYVPECTLRLKNIASNWTDGT